MHGKDEEAIKVVLAFLYQNGRVRTTMHPIMIWGAEFLSSGDAYKCLLDEDLWQEDDHDKTGKKRKTTKSEVPHYKSLLQPKYRSQWFDQVRRLSDVLKHSPNSCNNEVR
jgi:hypothetical protein